MGSYLKINNRETNSKTLSGIIIDAIRDIDSQIMNNENSTEKERKYFIPEYYKKTETEEFGCGDWTINKKGMALLVQYLKNMFPETQQTMPQPKQLSHSIASALLFSLNPLKYIGSLSFARYLRLLLEISQS